ncbi:cupin domain-containing protein [Citreicella sp. C3M06]|uniref:cupin domain-containing protein n=1 Tax=Roseobacteraceae TaxID=2854170 RepID=UPI001C098D8C|nr:MULTISPECIES: cupin domain-containing protein [Roseobacteraceae]MBU2959282.1 cupin domain-containing protein [Citreicella sp. C3M06]MDO6585187.1 cupin domain-containing protein [Salipiger sp. 1_MG-2023]
MTTTPTKTPRIFNTPDIPAHDRGNGVTTRLFCSESRCAAGVTTGTTTLPVGRSVQMHSHNCDEQIIILQGQAEAEFNGARHPIGPMEVAFIPKDTVHCFHNVGDLPVLMLFVYDAGKVTRTFAASGETVEHLSESDLAQPRS